MSKLVKLIETLLSNEPLDAESAAVVAEVLSKLRRLDNNLAQLVSELPPEQLRNFAARHLLQIAAYADDAWAKEKLDELEEEDLEKLCEDLYQDPTTRERERPEIYDDFEDLGDEPYGW